MNFIWIARLVRALIKGLRRLSGVGRGAVQTGGKASAGRAAREASKIAPSNASSAELLKEELAQLEPQGFEAFLFKQLPRPRLTERSASDLTLADAENYAGQATMFYDYNFPLFGHGENYNHRTSLQGPRRQPACAVGRHNVSVQKKRAELPAGFLLRCEM